MTEHRLFRLLQWGYLLVQIPGYDLRCHNH